VKIFLVVLDVVVAVALLVSIFLHSGKDAGLSMTFGGGGGSFGGTGVVQKNLDRITVALAVAFFALTIALGFVII
jgi:preprotein translocase subunit SecG